MPTNPDALVEQAVSRVYEVALDEALNYGGMDDCCAVFDLDNKLRDAIRSEITEAQRQERVRVLREAMVEAREVNGYTSAAIAGRVLVLLTEAEQEAIPPGDETGHEVQ